MEINGKVVWVTQHICKPVEADAIRLGHYAAVLVWDSGFGRYVTVRETYEP